MILQRLIQTVFRTRNRRSRCRPDMAVDVLEARSLLSAVTANFGVSQDTTLYAGEAELANGRGEYLLAGPDARGLIRFDVSAIPAGSTILDAVLTLNVGQGSATSDPVTLSSVQTSWGASGSDALGDETIGAAAQQFDATWLYRFYDGTAWENPGGDTGIVSAATTVHGFGAYEWLGGGLIDDVQSWVDNASENFGWALDAAGSLKAFISSDAPDSALAPRLEITYEQPPVPEVVIEGRVWNDVNTDGRSADDTFEGLGLTVFRSTYFNAFGGEEYWFRSANTQQWYFLTQDGALTQWDGTSDQLSGQVVRQVDPRFYYNPSLVVQTDEAEPWLNGHTVELLGADGSVVATTTTTSKDINQDGFIDPDLEGGWYVFSGVAADQQYSVRHVLPDGWKRSAEIEYDTSTGLEKLIRDLKLEKKTSFFEGWGGRNEKWVFSPVNGWHFLTPSGSLYRWDSQPPSEQDPLSGSLVAQLPTTAFAEPATVFSDGFDDPILDGEVVMRIDFGVYEVFEVNGRIWNDFDPNGLRDTTELMTEGPPDSSHLADGEAWFYDSITEGWFIVDVNGEMSYWGQHDGSQTQDGGDGVTVSIWIQQEPWLNGRVVELLDADGQVIATTVSHSIDLNNNGEIEYETERGHYVFEDVPAGDYTVRTITDGPWVQTAPVHGAHAEAIALDATYGFRSTSNDFHNWAGKNERWFIDSVGRWYYVLPDGNVYQWDLSGSAGNGQLTGHLIAELSSDFHADPTLLTDPDTTATEIQVRDNAAAEVIFGNYESSLRGDLL